MNMLVKWFGGAAILLLALGHASFAADKDSPIAWQAWDDKIFERAAKEHKLVLLDLGAIWCHWCHVMDEITYRDPEVVRLLQEKYIPVHVDQDSRPDLANRYEDYGWPATVIFKWDGSELAKRQGYIPPKPMASMLQAFVDDPTPGPSVEPEIPVVANGESKLSPEVRKNLRDRLIAAYDRERGGWGEVHKFLNWDALEYCLSEGVAGDEELRGMAMKTLESGLKLIDPVWGGVYQYSTDGDWDHPHFEKIMPFQAENLRIFALASVLSGDPRWLEPARKIRSYLTNFLTSPEGAFYTSQDADLVRGEHSGEYFSLDDAARRRLGIPRVDQHVYSRESGLAITGLCALYAAANDEGCLVDAIRATKWVEANRALPTGGFRHDVEDKAGPYLSDNLAMLRAFLSLHIVTADRDWLRKAVATARFIDSTFKGNVGFVSSMPSKTSPFTPKPQLDENVALARTASLLVAYTGDDSFRAMAAHAMGFSSNPAVIENLGFGGSGVLLADLELGKERRHLTIVGSKQDPTAKALFAAALRNLPLNSRIEWFDPAEGPLPNSDVTYPTLPQAAAFFCSNGTCSAPLKSPNALLGKLRRK